MNFGTPFNYRSSNQSEGLGLSQLRPLGYSHVGSPADPGYTPDPRGALDAMYGNDDRSQRSSWNRPGVGVPAFPRSRHTRGSGLSLHQIATTRNTQFGTRDPPLLTGHAFQSKEVHAFIQYIYQLIRAEAFDETILEKLVDDEAMGVLTLLFKTSEVSSVSPATYGWTYDWDVATIIEAL